MNCLPCNARNQQGSHESAHPESRYFNLGKIEPPLWRDTTFVPTHPPFVLWVPHCENVTLAAGWLVLPPL